MDRLISEKAVLEAFREYQGSISDFYKAVKAIPSAEPCEDAISREALKHKLQEHHDFFVNAYGGFSNLPQNDKSRVDEILNCIAMVVNEPSVKPQEKTGHCEDCKHFRKLPYHADTLGKCVNHWGFCPKGDWYCADFEPQESEVDNG